MQQLQSYAEMINAAQRRRDVVRILSKAACRLGGISLKQKVSDSALTQLDLSRKIELNMSNDNTLDNKELYDY
jgi:hypothetical protein